MLKSRAFSVLQIACLTCVLFSSFPASAEVRSGVDGGSQKAVALLAFGLLSLPTFGGKQSAVGLGAGFGTADDDGQMNTFNLHGFASTRWRGFGYDLVLLERYQRLGETGRFTVLPMFGGPIVSGEVWELRAMAGPQIGLYANTGDLLFGFAGGLRASVRVPLVITHLDVLYTPFIGEGEAYHQVDGILRLLVGPDWDLHPYLEGRAGFGPELSLFEPVGNVFHAEAGLGFALTW